MSHSVSACISLSAAASISRPFQLARPDRSWHAMAASSYSDGLVYVWRQRAGQFESLPRHSLFVEP
jgi:hypothetical protein